MDRPERTREIGAFRALRGGHQPSVDVVETEAGVVVRAELAGVGPEALRVTVHAGRLWIRGERRPPGDEGVLRHHRMEISFGPFERRVDLPVEVDQERVSASLEDGLLTVVLPRKQPVRRPIPVKEG